MALKSRYKVRIKSHGDLRGRGRVYKKGTIYTVTAQSSDGAKRIFVAEYRPMAGHVLEIWPMGSKRALETKRVRA